MRALHIATVSLFGLLASVAISCGNECSRASDCPNRGVCVAGTCAEPQASYLSCSSNSDCTDDSSVLVCRGGRCTFPESGVVNEVGPPTTDADMGDVARVDTGTTADAGP